MNDTFTGFNISLPIQGGGQKNRALATPEGRNSLRPIGHCRPNNGHLL